MLKKSFLVGFVTLVGLIISLNANAAPLTQFLNFSKLDSYNYTFGSEDININCTSNSGLPITSYSSSNPNVVTIVNNKIHLVGVGYASITAYQAGNATYNPATVSQDVNVYKGYQSVYFDNISQRMVGDGDFIQVAYTTSGLPLTITSDNLAVATIIGQRIHIVGVGKANISVSHPGDANWNPLSPQKELLTVIAPPNTLPTPWVFGNIDAPLSPGAATFASNVYTVSSMGAGFTGVEDQFKYVNTGASGDCELTMLVQSVTCSNVWGRGGLMIRESLNENARFIAIAMRPDKSVFVDKRTVIGASSTVSVTPPATVGGTTAAKYLKLKRVGNEFGCYYSTTSNGAWIQVGSSMTIAFTTNTKIGFFASGNAGSKSCSANFSQGTLVKAGINDAEEFTPLQIISNEPKSFEIYPNPAVDIVHINTNSSIPSNVVIFDSRGKIVYNKSISDNISIPTSEIGTKGMYFVRINNESKKLIIVR